MEQCSMNFTLVTGCNESFFFLRSLLYENRMSEHFCSVNTFISVPHMIFSISA